MERKEKDFDKMWDEVERKISEVSRMVENLREEAEDFERETSNLAGNYQFQEESISMLDACAKAFVSSIFEDKGITKIVVKRSKDEDGDDILEGVFYDKEGNKIVGAKCGIDADQCDCEDEECDCDCECECEDYDCGCNDYSLEEKKIAKSLEHITEGVGYILNEVEFLHNYLLEGCDEESGKGKHSK